MGVADVVNLCSNCLAATTGIELQVGDCALVFGMAIDIVASPACDCPCHDGHACVLPRRNHVPAAEHVTVVRKSS